MIRPALSQASAPAPFSGGPFAEAAAAACAHAPYLSRVINRRGDLLVDIDAGWADRLLAQACADARAIATAPPEINAGMRTLRRAKEATHLAIALADIAGFWPLMRVTGALTDFADAALAAAAALGARVSAERGDFTPGAFDGASGPAPGIALIAMGKMGAGELNYSSDIDFSVFFDAEVLAGANAREPRVAAVRFVAPVVRALEEVTADGYVFRTDLRLRPDPGSTPVAVSIASAEHYYQNLGQNWERAAFIKARAAGGDRVCGRAFLTDLESFIWRKHLDFAAVEDVHSIKRQILSAHKSAELGDPVFDVKLGRGGIRDIELFAQTQQLILGGRDRKLRVSGTLAALDALSTAGAISAQARDAMSAAYVFYRGVEHRIQMLEDAQTHRTPSNEETRARVAALCGFETLAAFDAALIEQRRIVAEIDHQLFGREESLADPLGSLIFTGVEDQPETLETIAKLGFARPEAISQSVRGWHHGRIRAMRSARAREALTRLTPKLLRAFAAAGDPDAAFERFSSFFGGLSAGVQVLSLLEARPALLDLLARLFSLAPLLSDKLARRPALLDALIEPRFLTPLAQDAPGARFADLQQRLRDADGFEAKLNAARRFQREEVFRISVQLLDGGANAAESGAAHAELAEACVAAMTHAALQEVERAHGPQPGAFAVLALGKFGGRELSDNSDLDLMAVYDAPPEHSGMAAPEFYTRVTQRLISALSAPTEEGMLYEIDTKLRPSGSKGPVAVRLSSFERYYADEAWTWEMQALTRLRPAAGDPALGAQALAIAHAALARPRDEAKTLGEVADMRALMDRERAGKSMWDLKLAPGGFVDIEFIAQALQLTHAVRDANVLQANTGDALDRLAAAGALDKARHARLTEAWRLWSDLQQTLRVCVGGHLAPEEAAAPLLAKIAALAGAVDFDAARARVSALQKAVREDFEAIIGSVRAKSK